jgi:hypothetical protein
VIVLPSPFVSPFECWCEGRLLGGVDGNAQSVYVLGFGVVVVRGGV